MVQCENIVWVYYIGIKKVEDLIWIQLFNVYCYDSSLIRQNLVSQEN